MQTSRILLIAAGLTATVATSPAQAQNALGNGNALDANPRLGSYGVNGPGRDYNSIIRMSNAVVEGTATGGRAFRGVGATRSGSAFRDSLSGDANYGFYRDSALSGLATSRARSSDLLMAQSALYSGNSVPEGTSAQGFADSMSYNRYAVATTGAALGSLRSTAQREWDQSRQPSVLGAITSKDDSKRPITYQPLRGLGFSDGDKTDVLPFSPLERPARMTLGDVPTDDGVAGNDARINGKLGPDGQPRKGADDPDAPKRPGSSLDSGRIPTRVDEVEKRFAASKAEAAKTDAAAVTAAEAAGTGARPGTDEPTSTARPGTDPALEKLRQSLRQPRSPQTPPGASPSGAPGTLGQPGDTPKLNPNGTPDRSGPRPSTSASGRNVTPVPPTAPLTADNQGTLDTLRKMTQGKPLPSLSDTPRNESDWYNIVMSRGQELVNTGKYFEAEETFTRLLAAKEGDAMARLGRVHAQIGAGAYLTAGKGLVELYRVRPELLPVRVEEAGVMPRAVAADAAKQLQLELDKPGSAIGEEAAVLLAYLGFQFNETAWLTRGLTEAPKRTADLDRGVVEVMAEVWKVPAKP